MSGFSSFSSSFSDDPPPSSATNCYLCKVKLNQIGITHTRSAKCSKCQKIICINCISPLQKFRALQQKVCKTCGHKTLLFSPDDPEMDEMGQERLALKIELKKLSTEKIALQLANKALYNELETKKEELKEVDEESELENLKKTNAKLKEKMQNQERDLESCKTNLKNLQEEMEKSESMIKDLNNWFWFSELPAFLNGKNCSAADSDEILKKKIEYLRHKAELNQLIRKNQLTLELLNKLKQQISDYNTYSSILLKERRNHNPISFRKCSSCIVI